MRQKSYNCSMFFNFTSQCTFEEGVFLQLCAFSMSQNPKRLHQCNLIFLKRRQNVCVLHPSPFNPRIIWQPTYSWVFHDRVAGSRQLWMKIFVEESHWKTACLLMPGPLASGLKRLHSWQLLSMSGRWWGVNLTKWEGGGGGRSWEGDLLPLGISLQLVNWCYGKRLVSVVNFVWYRLLHTYAQWIR